MMGAFNEDWLAARARATPHAAALIIDRRQWSYGQLNALTETAAQNLQAYAKNGARVAVLSANGLPFVCLVHALARIGAVLVPINRRLSASEIQWQLQRAHCSALVFDEASTAQALEIESEGLQLTPFARLLQETPAGENKTHPPFDIEALQAIVFTSGTSGRPKGASLSFANHFYSAVASGYRLGVLPADRWLCCLPLYHVGGLAILLRSCLYGTAVELHDGFDPVKIDGSFDENEISIISLVPTMLRRLLDHRSWKGWPLSLRHVLLGGAAPPADLLAECREIGLPVSVTYGLTEAASQVATMTPPEVDLKPGSAGKPLLFTRVAIAAEDGRTVGRERSWRNLGQRPYGHDGLRR